VLWVKFVLCAAALVFAGYQLSYHGNSIAEHTGLTKSLMGFFFLSVATSLPEFVTSGSAAGVARSADLALGDLFGTITINLMIIALLDLIEGHGALMFRVKKDHILCIALTSILLTITSFSLSFSRTASTLPQLLGLGVDSWLLMGIFLLGVRLVWRMESAAESPAATRRPLSRTHLSRTLAGFSLSFGAIVVLGIWLVALADEISTTMQWSESLVGTFLLGLITSLPELIVSVTALQFNVDMAIGNILGSNFFDMMILPLCDGLWGRQPILAATSLSHLVPLLVAVIMNSILIVGLMCRSRKSFLKMGWEIIAMAATFAAGSALLVIIR